MLADQIVEFFTHKEKTHVNLAKSLNGAFISGFVETCHEIEQAPKFDLSGDVIHLIQDVSYSSPLRLESALTACRLPYPTMWVEFEHKHRTSWMEKANFEPSLKPFDVERDIETTPPIRLGFLLRSGDRNGSPTVTISLGWTLPDPDGHICNLCPMDIEIDLNPEPVVIDPVRAAKGREEYRRLAAEPKSHARQWGNKDPELDAMYRLEQRIDLKMPDRMIGFFDMTYRIMGKDGVEHIRDNSRTDLMGEWRMAIAIITVLNARNAITMEDGPDFTKLNKSRMKSGKRPLMEYRQIKLGLSKVQKNRQGSTGGREAADPHLVRGHWKLRNGKLFWWTPHVRGGASVENAAPRYKVTT